jgi:phospholipid/cholesterol/gamma-HCH transport system ATP-binding protein
MNAPVLAPPTAALEMHGGAITALKNPKAVVAQDVNWTVRAGDFWVVGGPQHSGKTDFLMTAGGILAPAGGEYFLLGERMPIFEEARMQHRLKLGLVFDGGQLLNSLTLAENIALPLRYHSGLPAAAVTARVHELLDTMELAPEANRAPIHVGRSWQQRAGLARALALRPEVLLLDSPLTGLDARHAAWWLEFLRQLSRGHHVVGGKPLTLVATADDLRPWRRVANRVACLGGRRFLPLGEWAAADACSEPLVQDLLRE